MPLVLLAAAACGHGPGPGTALPGAVAPRQAVIDFLGAVKAQDLQAMSAVWGSEKGPARDQLPRTQLDQRLIIMQGCYAHDRYQILDETAGTSGRRIVRVSLVRGSRTKTTSFSAVPGPSKRYFVSVEDADFNSMLKDFCPK
jgi:hypothetical protein